MASIGDVTVTLKADTAQFTTAMQGASTQMEAVNARFQRVPLVAKEAKAGIAEVATALETVAPAAEAAEVGVAGLMAEIVPLAVGSAVAIAVVAGLSAIVGWVRGLATESRETKDAVAAVTDELDRLNQTALGTAKAKAAIIGQLQKDKQKELGDFLADPSTAQLPDLGARRAAELRDQLNDLNVQYLRAQGVVANLRQSFEADWVKKHTEHLREHAGAAFDDAGAMNALERSMRAYLGTLKDPILFTRSGVLGIGPKGTTPLDLAKPVAGPSDNEIMRSVTDTIKTLPRDLIPKIPKNDWAALGKELGSIIGDGLSHSLARSIVTGARSLGDALKQAFNKALEEVLAALIKSVVLKKIGELIASAITGGASGGGGGLFGSIFGIFKGVFGGVLSGASGVSGTGPNGWGGDASMAGVRAAIIVPTSKIPPNPSPIAMARDAQHQALWVETARVLQTQGVQLQLR